MSIWEKIRFGNIAGIIDCYDAVHSELSDTTRFHEELFQTKGCCAWRWSFDKGIWAIGHGISEEYHNMIEAHLEKKYGIRFMENGFHDIDFIIKKYKKI